jgi:hypothetical protein
MTEIVAGFYSKFKRTKRTQLSPKIMTPKNCKFDLDLFSKFDFVGPSRIVTPEVLFVS